MYLLCTLLLKSLLKNYEGTRPSLACGHRDLLLLLLLTPQKGNSRYSLRERYLSRELKFKPQVRVTFCRGEEKSCTCSGGEKSRNVLEDIKERALSRKELEDVGT